MRIERTPGGSSLDEGDTLVPMLWSFGSLSRRLRGSSVLGEARAVGWTGWALFVRALRVLRAAGPKLLAASIAAAACGVVAFAGWPSALAPGVFFLGLTTTLAMRSTQPLGGLLRAGTLIGLFALPCAGAVLVGARLAELHGEAHFAAGWALFLGLTFFGTAVLVPLLETAHRLARGGTFVEALAAAMVATGRRGLVVTLLTGLVASACIAIVPLLDALGPVRLFDSDAGWNAWAIGGGGAAAGWLGLSVLGAALATEPEAPRTRSRSAFAFVLTGIGLLALATVLGALLVPAPLDRLDVDTLARTPTTAPRDTDPYVSIELTDGRPALVVRGHGGSTLVVPVTPHTTLTSGSTPTPIRGADGYLYAVLSSDRDYWGLRLDEEGHHVESGPLARLEGQLLQPSALGLLVAALAVLAAWARFRGRARLFRAIRLGRETMVSGRLRAEGPMEVTGRLARTDLAHLETDGALVTLPPKIVVLGSPTRTLTPGMDVTLVSPSPLEAMHFRGGATPCPEGAVLLVGPPDARPLDEVVGAWALAASVPWLALAAPIAIVGAVLTLVVSEAPVAGTLVATTATAVEVDTMSARSARVRRSSFADDVEVIQATATRLSPRAYDVLLEALSARSSGALFALESGEVLDLVGFQSGDEIVAVAGVPTAHAGDIRRTLAANAWSSALGIRVRRGTSVIDLVFVVERSEPVILR